MRLWNSTVCSRHNTYALAYLVVTKLSHFLHVYIGTEIYVYGTTDSTRTQGGCKIGFEVDGVAGLEYNDPFQSPSFHNLFFSKTGLESSNHTLKISNLNNHTWTIDYIVYTTTNSSSANTASSGSSNGGNGGNAINGDNSWNGGNAIKTKNNAGAIAGGVIGGLTFLGALLLLAVLLLKRRKRSHRMDERNPRPIASVTTKATATPPPNYGDESMVTAALPTRDMVQAPSQAQLQHQHQYSLLPASKNSSGNPFLGHNS